MNVFRKFFRLIYINFILLKYGLDKLVWATPIFRPMRILIIFFPWRWFQKHQRPTGEAIRDALIALGPIFVKFGQMLSTRQDFLPEDIAEALASLQDDVPPFEAHIAQQLIESSLNKPLDELFQYFDMTPTASASIAQVHKATLFNGDDVVVKVLRPNIAQQIKQDIGLLETFASALEHVSFFKQFKPLAVVQEIKNTLLNEIDLTKEAANGSQLKRNFAHSDLLHVPQIYWDYCRKNVLVIERIKGTRISDITTLKQQHVDLKCLAERGVEIFFTQVFRDCFFHADMHPGNIFVDTTNPVAPRYIAIDFGIMGTLNPIDQRYLAENFLAFFERDYRRVALLHIESGWVPKGTSVSAFEAEIRTMCEPIFEKPLKSISFAQTLIRLFQVTRKFQMEIQPQLLLLQKTMVSVEGLGRQLYPDLDLWSTAKPYLEKWVKAQYSPKKVMRKVRHKIPLWVGEMLEMPGTLQETLQQWQSQFQPYLKQSTKQLSSRHVTHLRALVQIGLGCACLATALTLAMQSLTPELLHRWGFPIALGLGGVGFFLIQRKLR